MQKVINPELIVYKENRDLNKSLLFFIEQGIDWETLFNLKEEQYRQSQIILAKLSGAALISSYKTSNNGTRYTLHKPLYVDYTPVEIDIDRYYELFSNTNLGQPLGRKKNKQEVIDLMTMFLSENQFDYDTIVEQTRLWIADKQSKGQVEYVPQAANFIYKRDKDTGEIIGSPLLDLLNDPIEVKKFGLL